MADTACNDTAQQANLYELRGYDISITYSTTSIDGTPRFNYTDGTDIRNFSGKDILVEDTPLGRIVSVQLENNAADQGFEYVGLLLPKVQLVDEQSTDIQTLALFSRETSFAIPTAPVQSQVYNSVCLSGNAQSVAF